MVPSVRVTRPVGTTPPLETVTVKFTVVPILTGLAPAEIVTVDGSWLSALPES